MKKYILVGALLASQLTFADQLPVSWNNDSDIVEDSALTNFENTFDTHSQLASNLVEKDATAKKWEMFGYVTTFGVSGAGKIGLLASSGAAAVEVYWRKKPVAAPIVTKTALAASTPEDVTGDDVVITTNEDIDQNVDEVLSVVKTRKEVRVTDGLRAQIRNEIQNLKNTSLAIEAMEASPGFNPNWFVKMLRLDLFISAEGALTPAVVGGAEIGVRVFWTRTVKKTQPLANKMNLALSKNRFADAISNILVSLDSVNIDEHTKEAVKQGFVLDTIRLGLGVNATGQVVVGKGTGSAMMNVMLAKKPTPPAAKMNNLVAMDVQVEDENGQVLNISKEKFSKGLIKSFKMSEKIISKAARKQNRKFEPFLIWNIFTFTRGGSIGLVKVNGVGQVHLFFNKK